MRSLLITFASFGATVLLVLGSSAQGVGLL